MIADPAADALNIFATGTLLPPDRGLARHRQGATANSFSCVDDLGRCQREYWSLSMSQAGRRQSSAR
jgi:hypothetical protein